jgi:hypothetical protein
MDQFNKHILERLTNVEEGIRELREVTWPVCQALIDKNGPYSNRKQKKRFFKFLDFEEVRVLTRLKALFTGTSQDVADAELRWILVEEPLADAV